MASGFSDWINFLGVTGQGSGWLTQRPIYGAAQWGSGAGAVGAGDTRDYVTVAGKGVIYCGFLAAQGIAIHSGDYISIIIDGVTIQSETFVLNDLYGIDKPSTGIFYNIYFSDVTFRYTMGLGFNYTFESSFILRYKNMHADAITVFCRSIYALIS